MKYKNVRFFAFLGIFVVLAVMLLATYAYFTVEVEGSGKDVQLNSHIDNFALEFTDTSTISIVNAYTGDSVTKEFTVRNISAYDSYYDLIFTELINNFEDKSDLVFTVSSSDGGINRSEKVVPSTNDEAYIGMNIPIASGQTHSYVVTVTFKRTDDDQSDNMNKTFSSKIFVKSSDGLYKYTLLYKNNSIGKKILADNTLLSAEALDFSTNGGSGLYYTNESIHGATSYFFRGDNTLNNNLIVNNMCFKIVRFTENRGIRLIYNGLSSNGTCSNNSSNISNVSYNTSNNYNAYVGFMYGSANSTSFVSEHNNTNVSNILSELYTWLSNNLSNYSDYLTDSTYCNNRKTVSFTYLSNSYSNKGYSNENTGYDSFYRLNVLSNPYPDYDCVNISDRFSKNPSNGNRKLSSFVGLLTADEAAFAGYANGIDNTNNFLNNGTSYWTMTPAYFYSYKAYNYNINSGNLSVSPVDTSLGLRPVITISGNLVYVSGNGSLSTPYQVTR